ncbi:CinA family protein [Alcaligenaceae bacterium]|nr:CinA family protein [Alcaligenaceae bacterium]
MNDIESVARYMHEHELTLVTAESCTAGLIAARLVDVHGAGDILDCAYVAYSATAKQGCLDVKESTIESFGLTSEEVSMEMAHGAIARSQANVAIANTGIAESVPDGPPEGTQCFAWVFKGKNGVGRVFSKTHVFHGTRNEVRAASADFALLEMVRLHQGLRGEPPHNERPAATGGEWDILPNWG